MENQSVSSIFNAEKPSERKFGVFFSVVFCLAAAYFFITENLLLAIFFMFLALLFLTLALFKASALRLLNELWSNLGKKLNIIFSLFLLFLIYFVLISPVAVFFRVIRRDELKLDFSKANTSWHTKNNEDLDLTYFQRQF